MLASGYSTARTRHHLQQILTLAFGFEPGHQALVVFDARSPLSKHLTEAYRSLLPQARLLDFDQYPPTEILAAIDPLQPGDLAVLIQSENFRLGNFRLRVELFKRGLKVIEHMHLEHLLGEEMGIYLDALEYDAAYMRTTGRAIQSKIDAASQGRLEFGADSLWFRGGFEPGKVNIGDYSGMKNVGGLFPIGEVFTEARDLTLVEGRLHLFAFADTQFQVDAPETPLIVDIEKGRVARTLNPTAEWDKVLSLIRADEGEVWLREIGFGLNKAMHPHRRVRSIGTFERMCGIHFSLGATRRGTMSTSSPKSIAFGWTTNWYSPMAPICPRPNIPIWVLLF
jgi:aminopeptidase